MTATELRNRVLSHWQCELYRRIDEYEFSGWLGPCVRLGLATLRLREATA